MHADPINQSAMLVLGQSIDFNGGSSGPFSTTPVWVIFLIVIASILGIMLVTRWVVWPAFKGIGWLIGSVARFIGAEVRDLFRLLGAVITMVVFVPLVLGTILIGRWSASAHFGRSLQTEMGLAGKCVYRLVIANFLTSFGMRDVVAGIEERVPQAMADVPGTDGTRPKSGQFDGYKIVGSLAGGGSGGKLYIAEPDAIKVASYERNGHFAVGQVVIKSFSIRDGSSLPQIVRESQSLPAAKKLGLVLDHELTPDRFFYAMRYVPGQSLTAVTHQLHAASAPPVGARGLDDESLRTALGIVADLVTTLDAYHKGGLWHKDVKPDNIIVDGKRAHLVDFGLVTPLRSAMTLTTHGTEYFRDPEMVKMALKGVKVHEVDGARFDLYGAGAVLYSIIENSFPAHGVLSQISMRCPDALRWVVRRAMTDYDKRYPSASAMLRDIDAIRHAADPMALKPGQLPSMQDEGGDAELPVAEVMPDFPVNRVRQAASPVVPPPLPQVPVDAVRPPGVQTPRPAPGFAAAAGQPEVRVTNWLTGAFEVVGGAAAAAAQGVAAAGAVPGNSPRPGARRHDGTRRSAMEQLAHARDRAAAARERAQTRIGGRRSVNRTYSNNPNAGSYTAVAVAAFVALVVFGGVFTSRSSRYEPSIPVPSSEGGIVSMSIVDRDDGVERASAPMRTATVKSPKVENAVALVVVDLKKPLDATHEKEIKATVARLREAGFEVRGEYPGGEPDDTDLELTATAIKAAGGLAVDTSNGEDAVARWLTESDGDADLVVWIKPLASGRGEDMKITRVVIGPKTSSMDTDAKKRAGTILKAGKEAAR